MKLKKANLVKALNNNHTILDHALNEIPIRVFWKDLNSVYLGCNQIFAEDAGKKSPEEVVGHTDYEFWPDQAEAFRKDDSAVMSTGQSKAHFEEPQARPGGNIAWLNTTKIPLRNSEGEIYGVLGIYEDITETKEGKILLSDRKAELEQIFQALPDALVYANPDREIIHINPACTAIFGYSAEEIIGKNTEVLYMDYQAYLEQGKQRFNSAAHPINESYEVQYRRKNGEPFPGETVGTQVRNSEGKLIGFIGLIRDITERKQSEDEIANQKAFLQLVIDSDPNYIFVKNIEGRFVLINKALADDFGVSVEDIIGKLDSDFSPKEEEVEQFHSDDYDVIKNQKEKFIPEEKMTTSTGEIRWLQTIKRPIIDSNNETLVLGVCSDITERKKAEELLTYQANYDALTGLINRREFERRAERLLSTIERDKGIHALCFMDLDQFKVINDTCGHFAGDEMLRQISSEIQSKVRDSDTLARLGGDEFGILMEHCSLNDAHRVITSIHNTIKAFTFSWEEHNFKVGASMGLVPIINNSANLSSLLKQADVACYMAKDKGRNRIHVHNADDEELAQRYGEMQWVTRLNQAIKENRFCLYAQTIIPLDNSVNEHYELLIRMIGENGEIIPPGSFLPAAERYNLIDQLDTWVVENTFRSLAANPTILNKINSVSINLSGQSLTKHDSLDFIISKLNEYEIDGHKICFEITETAAITNLSMAMKFIASLKKLDCQFSLDDFGSGLSSFGYLKSLPVDYLKIDGMFVKDIVDDPIDHAMVKSINEIGQVMGMKTIAEFVENDVIKGMLKEIGVDYAQGYGIGKPFPIDELFSS